MDSAKNGLLNTNSRRRARGLAAIDKNKMKELDQFLFNTSAKSAASLNTNSLPNENPKSVSGKT
jgi:hypothetical protein